VTEPDAGSDVAGIRTRAVREAQGWRLDGAKTFITNGVHADLYFVAARTDPAAKRSRGVSMFIVETGTPGLHVVRQLDKMGWRCSDTAELSFESCRIPADHLLGGENEGFYAIMRNFQNERLVAGAMAVAEAETALDLALDYVRTRKAFGAPLWDKQGIRQRVSALAARIAAARQLVYHTAWLDSQGIDCVRETSMVKALCGELVNAAVYDCLQFHGGATEVMLEEVAKRLTADSDQPA
jgi:acyl-CoA dehydrogenase